MPIGLVPALIMGGATVGGSAIAAHASGQAASEQEQAAQNALGFQQQAFNTAQAQLAPFRNLGASSLANLYAMAGQPIVTPSPGGWGFQPRPMPVMAPMQGAPPMAPQGAGGVPRPPMASIASIQPEV